MLKQALLLAEEFHMFPPAGEKLVVAVSGGADSVCLLHWLWRQSKNRGFFLVAAHYNHQLRGQESQRDEDFVKELVSRFDGVELTCGRGDVGQAARQNGRGVEETAREMRYAFLDRVAQAEQAGAIATAHNAQDQGETVLMHLIRGAGRRGLGGIQPRRDNVVRPLLTTTRQEIEEYLNQHACSWVEDGTNRDMSYTRNRLRHQIYPLLEELNPNLTQTLGRTAFMLREDEKYLNAQAAEILAETESGRQNVSLPAKSLAKLPSALQGRAVQLLAEQISPRIILSLPQRRAVVALAVGESPSAHINLPSGLIVRREYERLIFSGQVPSLILEEETLLCSGNSRVGAVNLTVTTQCYSGQPQTPWQFWLSQEKTQAGIVLRRRRARDRITRPGRPGGTVKKRMMEEKIPRLLRDGLPVFCCGGVVAAVAGLGVDAAFLPQVGEQAWYIDIEAIEDGGKG